MLEDENDVEEGGNHPTSSIKHPVSACHPAQPPLQWSRKISFGMIELIQFPWSPFCIVQRRILEFSGTPFKTTEIPNGDRSLIWKLTRGRYYGVPIVRDGRNVIFETGDDSQVIAKYIDSKLKLGLFPWPLEGVQSILWRYIENDIEGPCFQLNDTYFKDMVPASEHAGFVRHKERKFGRGCISAWRSERKKLLTQLEEKLMPFEEMLLYKPFLLDARPRFVDFDLFGMLGNFLYSGHYRLPAAHNKLKDWHRRMSHIELKSIKREKELHPGYKRSAARPGVFAQL
jgi:glutathione S-transferase